MECLDEAELAALFSVASGVSRVASGVDLDAHLDGCSACRSLVAAYAAVGDDDTMMTPTVPSSPMGPARALEVGDRVGQRYRLERVVGEGGMGVVWAAEDLLTGERVAIKTLKSVHPELLKRFDREARVSASIGHPNVVDVRAILQLDDGSPAFVMDLLEGRSLATELHLRGGTLPVEEAVAVLLPLLSAVRAAHAKGILHRDLKPQNVFLAGGDGGPPVVTLLDFGLAKLLAKDEDALTKLTRTGAVMGTPQYMAPEQLYGDPAVDARADIWAVGAIAYEMLSGLLPLEGKSLAQLVRSAARGVVRPLPASVPAPLGNVIHAMLAIEPAGRPSLADVHHAFSSWRPS